MDLQEGGQDVKDHPDLKEGIFGKTKKVDMCQDIIQNGFCERGNDCDKAHWAIELDLVSLEDNIRNLQDMIKTSTKKLKESKPLEAWRPARQGVTEQSKYLPLTLQLT